jgi:hypothetical protein
MPIIKQPTMEDKLVNRIIKEYSFYDIGRYKESKSLTNFFLVLDLDETLVHTFEPDEIDQKIEIMSKWNEQEKLELRSRLYEFEILDANTTKEDSRTIFWGITRPSLKFFLLFCSIYFKGVLIWSAGVSKYVERIVDIIFKDIFPPRAIYDRRNTIQIDDEYRTTYKPLRNMFEDEYLKSLGMNSENTFVIDDRKDTFSQNPENGIRIKRYEPKLTYSELVTDDPALKQLMFWFLRKDVMRTKNVADLNLPKKRIFKEPYHIEVLKTCKIKDGSNCYTKDLFNIIEKIQSNNRPLIIG